MARGGWLTFRNNLRVIFTMIGFRIVFLTIFVSYGLTLLSLPALFFWNRRARRLRREPKPAEFRRTCGPRRRTCRGEPLPAR